jgi:tetratricopeptide (TPR) repeat protein
VPLPRHTSASSAQAYLTYAKACEGNEELKTALLYHERCLSSAQEAGIPELIGDAHYHLGQCLELLSEAAQAIEHYQLYLDSCKQSGDNDGQGAAAFALASAYQQLGDTASAVTHLEAFIDLAQGTGQVRSQAEACNSLGVIHSKQGDARSAVHYFERFYELARSLGDRALTDKVSRARWTDKPAAQCLLHAARGTRCAHASLSRARSRAAVVQARVNLGIARGNLVMGAYTQVVMTDLDALLAWKNRRIPFAEVAPRKG